MIPPPNKLKIMANSNITVDYLKSWRIARANWDSDFETPRYSLAAFSNYTDLRSRDNEAPSSDKYSFIREEAKKI